MSFCKAKGGNPEKWLMDLLAKLPATTEFELYKLLPDL